MGMVTMSDDDALPRLEGLLAGMGGDLAVAVSGGVDSLTLATVANLRLGSGAVAMLHATSPAVPARSSPSTAPVGGRAART